VADNATRALSYGGAALHGEIAAGDPRTPVGDNWTPIGHVGHVWIVDGDSWTPIGHVGHVWIVDVWNVDGYNRTAVGDYWIANGHVWHVGHVGHVGQDWTGHVGHGWTWHDGHVWTGHVGDDWTGHVGDDWITVAVADDLVLATWPIGVTLDNPFIDRFTEGISLAVFLSAGSQLHDHSWGAS
jgi:hypothetical protein